MNFLKSLWKKYNPFDIDGIIDCIVSNASSIREEIALSKQEIIQLHFNMELLEDENEKLSRLINLVANSVSDMMWAKTLDGKYLLANKSIIDGLFCGLNPIGKTDVELSKQLKMKYGDDKHTFGDICFNSDLVVIKEKLEGGIFTEYGLVKGKVLYLQVKKTAVLNDNGDVIMTVGVGRDITAEQIALEHLKDEMSCPAQSKCRLAIENIINKYKFEG